jgi:hypothetical protein
MYGATEVSCAQRQVRIEYDAGGNVIKQHSSQKTMKADLDDRFAIKVYPSPTTGPLRINVYEGISGQTVSCNIQLIVTNVVGNGAPVINKIFSNGNISIDLSKSPNGIYGLYFLVFIEPQKPISNSLIKVIKKS